MMTNTAEATAAQGPWKVGDYQALRYYNPRPAHHLHRLETMVKEIKVRKSWRCSFCAAIIAKGETVLRTIQKTDSVASGFWGNTYCGQCYRPATTAERQGATRG